MTTIRRRTYLNTVMAGLLAIVIGLAATKEFSLWLLSILGYFYFAGVTIWMGMVSRANPRRKGLQAFIVLGGVGVVVVIMYVLALPLLR